MFISTVILGVLAARGLSAEGDGRPDRKALAEALHKLSPTVLPEPMHADATEMVPRKLRAGLNAANRRSADEWRRVQSRDDWQRLRDEKLALLREAIGPFPQKPCDLRLHVASTVEGEGYRIQNLVFQSRPGLWVTANLYVPAKPKASMPGLLICHAHHTPKEHAELQDMGMMWARAGCLVLVPDMLGHGERRQHPFHTEDDYDKPYRVGRQDYYFRYDLGMQLHLAGESLMGWFAWDLRRCIDVLLSQRGVDAKRVVILGAVAGGGDPAAVAAALDGRITAAVVFNFGGAQPESPYPLPEDAEAVFNFAGSGSSESTRNLRRSTADGFLPWVIVGAMAPRRFVYAHEFTWDRPRDPVWKRLEAVWELYDARGRLAGIQGRGTLKGRPPGASHCTHIGPVHRASLHPILASWFDISAAEPAETTGPQGEKPPTCTESKLPPRRAHGATGRHWDLESLRCMTPELARKLKPKRLNDLLTQRVASRIADVRSRRAKLSHGARRERLRQEWAEVLGSAGPTAPVKVVSVARDGRTIGGTRVDRVRLEVEPGIVVPLLLLCPGGKGTAPVVVAIAHAGKDAFLRERAEAIAELLAGGVAVCLPDLRGLGETKPDGARERWGALTAAASTALMHGDPMVAARLRDLRSVLAYLRDRSDLDAARTALWGDSFAQANPPDREFRMPRHMDDRPRWSEPLGGLLVLLGALFEDHVCAVYVRGGLSDFASVVSEPFVYIPPDVVVPGLLTVGDMPDVAAALAPRPVRMDGLVDGFHRLRTKAQVQDIYRPAQQSYDSAGVTRRLVLDDAKARPAEWLIRQLRGK